MGQLSDELRTTPPKLVLTSLPIPSHKLPPAPPGALTPPLHPMVSVPFKWEEVPGRPRIDNPSSPCKPKCARYLELPPRMLVDSTKVADLPSSPNTVLDGPRVGRSLSQRFCFEDQYGPKNIKVTPDLGLVGTAGGLDLEKNVKDMRAHFGSCRWASGKGPKWGPELDFSSTTKNTEVDIKVKVTRFRKSRKSFYTISYKSSRLLESIYESVKQMVTRRHISKRS